MAFFPLYPSLMHVIGWVLGNTFTGILIYLYGPRADRLAPLTVWPAIGQNGESRFRVIA